MFMDSLFTANLTAAAPLAERLRPKTLADVVGQEHLQEPLRTILNANGMISFVLWGPPGTGKTTLARIFAAEKKARFEPLSAVSDGVKRIREVAEEAKRSLELQQRKTIIFIDEIHALNKSQQDVLLPHLEAGTFYLIGATTENPSFSLNAALLSRVRVFLLKSLDTDALAAILEKAKALLGVSLTAEAEEFLLSFANGDARMFLNLLEEAGFSGSTLDVEALQKIASEKTIRYDRASDEHYWTISAFIKSMRASDPDAAIYYLARMLEGGEDPRFVARRMVIFASEDVGLADANALPLVVAAYTACEKIGMPEVRIILGHAVIYLSNAPKNNKSYLAIDAALAEVKVSGNLPIPLHLRNPSTQFLKDLGFGKGYKYPHGGTRNEVNLPDKIKEKRFFVDD